MYRVLGSKIRFHKEKGGVALLSVDNIPRVRWIHPVCAATLALFNGQRDRGQVVAALIELFSVEQERARQMIDKVTSGFGDVLESFEAPVERTIRYEPADLLYEPEGPVRARQMTAPLEVAWLVTERCHCDCSYCCIQTQPARTPEAGDGLVELSPEQAMALVEDCGRAGVLKVLLHGGEPFLRDDLPDLIARLIELDIFVSVSTKLRLRERVVRRLAEAGLEELQVSVDTDDPVLAETLVGTRGYLERVALANIDLLQSYGIRPRVNTVVLGANVGHIPRLIRVLARRGVSRITLSGYLRSRWKHDDAHFPGTRALEVMAREVAEVAREEGVEVELPPLASPRDLSLSQESFSGCSGGTTGLVVGADGRVALCDRLLPFAEAIVGHVSRSSLMDIWRSDVVRAFVYPDGEAFEGTECAGCHRQEDCDRRVRCYHRALMITGRIFAPDSLCDVVGPPPIRFF